MFTIDFNDHTDLVNESWYHQIEDLLNFAKEQEQINEDLELSVTFVDKNEIQEINKTYRDKDKVTDVISFALEEDEPEIVGLDMPRVLGDIIICTNVVKSKSTHLGIHLKENLDF